MVRAAALLALLTALATWYGLASHYGRLSLWPAVLLIACLLIPASFALVALALPLWSARGLLPVGLAFAVLAVAFTKAGFDVAANFAKLGAMTFLGWAFLALFETLSWVVLVACIIPWVDALSVWRGPTKALTHGKHEHIFTTFSVAFVVPGGGAARLGLPDVLFFGLFLAAAARFGLRVWWTWIGLTVGLALTIVLATWLVGGGLPALPGIALGFLVPNVDLLWKQVRARPAPGQTRDVADADRADSDTSSA